MGILVLIITGAFMGWIAAIFARVDTSSRVFTYAAAGIAGALAAGFLMFDGLISDVITPLTLAAAAVGAIAVLAVFHWLRGSPSS